MTDTAEPIAIVGSSCRFPGGVRNPSELWDLLRDPRDVLSKIPNERFNSDAHYHPDHSFPGHSNVRHAYLLSDNVRHFDNQFFNIQPLEASHIDPQQRLLLETVYESLESGGFTIEGLRGSNTGVYVGLMYADYDIQQYRDTQHLPTYHATGTARSIVSNRVSYFFDWHGPSMTIDTACSSSLVAVHQAVQALRSGEIKIGVAAGTNLILSPDPFISESKLKMLSPDGRSRMWDANANGYARGEGISAVILKTLRAALADGDNIEGIIRETGVNQDGRSHGITMPSATAQASLIKETYAKAGLDIKTDRCQYFEAHGTGTPAGDPIEAEAVSMAFFGQEGTNGAKSSPLFVGSIKTVIGHTESTAGLAGVLKVVQAMKHGFIPPNMHLQRLNPNVEPFYSNLKIPQELTAWPKPPAGQSRKASVNSFGFGGTNAHAIVESYEGPQEVYSASSFCVTPFLFSASSKHSLKANLQAIRDYLKENPSVDPAALAWTLRSRRSRLSQRVSLAASSIADLQVELDAMLGNFTLEAKSSPSGRKAKYLGVFTGQGAQYARMGASLIEKSPLASEVLDRLDKILKELPETDRPVRSLRQELMEHTTTSRINNATVSQPSCTALQIILVDILKAAGVEFNAVIGHSSGEIGAAYAAGLISAEEAICIAYYRGFHAHLASGAHGCHGAMMAAGVAQEEAEELCNDEYMEGRATVAACNAPTSVTISGDEDAIDEILDVLEDEGKFSRRLKVDKAYHSHHMVKCSTAYKSSIAAIRTRPSERVGECVWVSSVYPDRPMDELENLDASYWVDNMVSPVLFKQALEKVVSLDQFDGIIEVGPHPALKSPIFETLQNLKVQMPYTSVLDRSIDSIKRVSSALGYIWSQIDSSQIDFDKFEHAMGESTTHRFVSDLPRYKWNYSQEHWHESLLSRVAREGDHPPHPLLGSLAPTSSASRRLWKLRMRTKDLPWINEHQIQGQTVFPAAGYICTALESVPFITKNTPVQLVEIDNFRIHQALVLDGNNEETGIDVQFSVNVVNYEDDSNIKAVFTYESGAKDGFELISSGTMHIIVGEPSTDILPATSHNDPYMVSVQKDLFYNELKKAGYGYSGAFRALDDLNRKLRKVRGSIAVPDDDTRSISYSVHPGMLDAAFHAVFLALSHPGDGELWSLHIPTSIDKIRFNPFLCGENFRNNAKVPFISSVDNLTENGGYIGHAEIHGADGLFAAIQVEGLKVVPLTEATPSDDEHLFHMSAWVNAMPTAEVPGGFNATMEDMRLTEVQLRMASEILQDICAEFPVDHPCRLEQANSTYLKFVDRATKLMQANPQSYSMDGVLCDDDDDLTKLKSRFTNRIEVKILEAVAQQMPRVLHGKTSVARELIDTGLMEEWIHNSKAFSEISKSISHTLNQITLRHPSLHILEVASALGGVAKTSLTNIDGPYASLTITGASKSSVDKVRGEFLESSENISFAQLDVNKDFQTQGFKKSFYDVIIAPWVAHASSNLDQTLCWLRAALRPGGFLVLAAVTNENALHISTVLSCVSNRIPAAQGGLGLGPCIAQSQWASPLRKTGFSGIDARSHGGDSLPFPASVIVTQAVDEWVNTVREPLLATPPPGMTPRYKHMVMIGGCTPAVSDVLEKAEALMKPFFGRITRMTQMEDMVDDILDHETTVLVLQELDQPVFQNITNERFESLKRLFTSDIKLVWVTSDRLATNPYHNMIVGFARSAMWEAPALQYQIVDFEDTSKLDSTKLAEIVLSFQGTGSLTEQANRNALWPVEQEINIDSRGNVKVPRFVRYKEAGDRYNSRRRNILASINPHVTPTVISRENQTYSVTRRCDSTIGPPAGSDTTLRLHLEYSSLYKVKTPSESFSVVLGVEVATGSRYMGFVNNPSSIMDVPYSSLVPCSVPPQSADLLMRLTTANLLLPSLVHGLGKGEAILVHCPPEEVAKALASYSLSSGIETIFTHPSKQEAETKGWIHVSPYIMASRLRLLIPNRVSRVVSFEADAPSKPSPPFALVLPKHTSIISFSSMFVESSANTTCIHIDAILVERLTQAMDAALHQISQGCDQTEGAIDLAVLSGISSFDPLAVINWNTTSVPTVVKPIPASFRSDKSYWLVGLSGDMGLSIADWMIESGARHLVITSRNPKVEESWIQLCKTKGADVCIMSCDVTNVADLQRCHYIIAESMPPVAGVIQGAMVMRDAATREMTLEELKTSLSPKVEGSINLDRLFYNQALDFFVFLSSVAAAVGNTGQVNYSAGNMFMCGLAEQRRQRGLNASVANLGPIVGTGYITREMQHFDHNFGLQRGFRLCSESDVHCALAEAIEAGQPGSGPRSQAVMGLREANSASKSTAHWYNLPQFSHMTRRASSDGLGVSQDESGRPMNERLTDATSEDDVKSIISESFLADLRKMMFLDNEFDLTTSHRTDELGLDSLVAVKIRSWFLQKFEVNIPALKILKGVSIQEMVHHTFMEMPQKMIPKVKSDANNEVRAKSAAPEQEKNKPETPENGSTRDWDAETMPQPELGSLINFHKLKPPRNPPRVVVFTGATGFVGQSLVRAIAAESYVDEVICIAVRDTSKFVKVFAGLEKVQCYQGSLQSARLGLSAIDAETVFRKADAVIHLGATVSYLQQYSSLKRANFQATKELAALCVPRRIPFHFMSTAAVVMLSDGAPIAEESLRHFSSHLNEDRGYALTKWASEVYLERVQSMHNLPVVIHRPSSILRPSAELEQDGQVTDIYQGIIEYSRRLKAVPMTGRQGVFIDIVRPETLESLVIDAMLTSSSSNNSTRYIHASRDIEVSNDELPGYMAKTYGGEFRELSLKQWIREAEKIGLSPTVASVYEIFELKQPQRL